MKHTTVCGKSGDRPIGGPCQRKPRPRTMIETGPVRSTPSVVVDWLFKVSRHRKEEVEIGPAHAQIWLVRVPKQAALPLWLIGREVFMSTSITWISSCKPETSPRWNLIGQFSHKVTSHCSRCLGSFNVNSAGRRLVAVRLGMWIISHFMLEYCRENSTKAGLPPCCHRSVEVWDVCRAPVPKKASVTG